MSDDEFMGLNLAGTDISVPRDSVWLPALLEQAGWPQAVCPPVDRLSVLFVLERVL